MSIADLIQATCQDRKTARLIVRSGKKEANLYFGDGNLIHASLDGEHGEEVIYKILNWKDGSFEMQSGVKPPKVTIANSWSGILLEGARRIDEKKNEGENEPKAEVHDKEDHTMAKLDDVLKEMGNEITGYIGSMVVGMDGMNVAQHSRTKVDLENISAQMTMLLRMTDELFVKLADAKLQDNVITAKEAYVVMKLTPNKQYYLAIIADRRTGNLGNIRLVCKIYTEKLAHLLPQ